MRRYDRRAFDKPDRRRPTSDRGLAHTRAQPCGRRVAAVTALGATLRFATLGDQSFWAEEAITRRLVRMPLGTMLQTIPHSESTPPVYYLLAWLWTRVFGFGEIGLRSLSATLGTRRSPWPRSSPSAR